MRKSRAVRVAGFVGALGASAALVGFAASSTGAYFTDSHTGAVNASTGSVKVNVSPASGAAGLHQPAAWRVPDPAGPVPG